MSANNNTQQQQQQERHHQQRGQPALRPAPALWHAGGPGVGTGIAGPHGPVGLPAGGARVAYKLYNRAAVYQGDYC
jgi:hypothetical protein